ncbi:MAG: hypothetical protein IH820_03410, partial [Bacteroidetes bacterium]|nr:hypothetical protein [Bacteroidota bacterium]
ILAALFISLCILTNFVIDRGQQQRSIIQQGAQQQTQEPLAPLPQGPQGTPDAQPAQPAPAQQPAPDQN